MPKKKGSKKAKSGNGKKSKETADTMTLKEAVMVYQYVKNFFFHILLFSYVFY